MSDEPVPTAHVHGALPAFAHLPAGGPPEVVLPLYPLYSADQVGIATFLGGPIGGGWLIARNYKRLGQVGAAWTTMIATVVATAALLAIAFFGPQLPPIGLGVMGVVGMIAIARGTQGSMLAHHASVGGRKGSSWIALATGLVSIVITLGVVVGIAFAGAYITQPDSIDLGGDHKVFYKDGGTRQEAESVGAALQSLDYFGPQGAWVFVERSAGKHVVALVLADSAWADGALNDGSIAEYAETLSKQAFQGEPVDIWLLDENEDRKQTLAWEVRPGVVLVGKDMVKYRSGGTEAEARAVSVALAEFFETHPSANVIVMQEGGRHVVAFVVNEAALSDVDEQKYFYRFADLLSENAFAGTPVDIWLNDSKRVTHVKLPWESHPGDLALGKHHDVRYEGDGTQSEARAIADVLADYLALQDAATIVLSGNRSRRVVELFVNDAALDDHTFQRHVHSYSSALSKALDGTPVDIWLVADEKAPHVTLSWETCPAK
jgi:hypothetical protein